MSSCYEGEKGNEGEMKGLSLAARADWVDNTCNTGMNWK